MQRPNLLAGLIGITVACSSLAAPATAQQPNDAAWRPYRSIKVLYAGDPEGSRHKAFTEWLPKWFDDVSAIHIKELTQGTAAKYDVVIADWQSQYGLDGYPSRENSLTGAPLDLPDDFSKPVVSMSYLASNLRGRHKLDWL